METFKRKIRTAPGWFQTTTFDGISFIEITEYTKSPDKFIAELEHLRYRLRSMDEKLSDEMMINHILCSLPEEYDSKVEHLRDMLDENKELTLYWVIEALRSKFYFIS